MYETGTKRSYVNTHSMKYTVDVLFGKTPCRFVVDNPKIQTTIQKIFAPFVATISKPHQWFYIKTHGSNSPILAGCNLLERKATILVGDGTPKKELSDVVKIAFSTFLPSDHGIVLHASCLEYRGLGYIFVGKSGAGKSTIVQLAPHGHIVGDDSAVIQKVNGQYNLFITPFFERNDTIKKQQQITIKGIYLLHQSKSNKVAPASDPIEAFRHSWLLPQSFTETDTYAAALKKYWPVALDIAAQIPVYQLWFTKNSSTWDLFI